MSKKNKIIISIVGITIVLLALLGLTYAYYLTRIEGNTNTNSISVTTANLKLVYSDNSEEIITGDSALMPSSDPIGEKSFTVTNAGNDSEYSVIIDEVSTKIAGTNTDTNFLSNDFRYTLTCSITSIDETRNGTNCNNVLEQKLFPINGGVMTSNSIKEGDIHNYKLTLWYIDTGIDQSDDMGKSYQARVNIADITVNNPYSTGVSATDNKSLVYNIINNAKQNKNGTSLVNTPLTTPVVETSAFKYVDGNASQTESVYNSTNGSTTKYYTYGDSYDYTTSYTIKNSDGSAVSAVQGFSTLVGKYIVSTSGSSSSTAVSASNKSTIYYVAGVDSSKIYYIKLSGGVASNEYYYTYGDTYEFNEKTGNYTIKNSDGSSLQAIKYNTNYETLKNKYIVSTSGSTNETPVSGEDKNTIYKVSSNSTSEILKYYRVTKFSEQISTESVLSTTQDNYGTSYYFRGGVQDNYVLFNNMCFRIVRIEGDGSVKLTLAGEVSEGATDCTGVTYTSALINNGSGVTYGYKTITGLDGNTWYIADYENDTGGTSSISLKESLDTWFDSKFKSDGVLTAAGEKIKEETWCLGGSYDYKYDSTGALLDDAGLSDIYTNDGYYHWNYSAGRRLWNTKTIYLTCGSTEEKITSKVGTLTSDEVALAGANTSINKAYYLYDNAKNMYYWTLSRADFYNVSDGAFFVDGDG